MPTFSDIHYTILSLLAECGCVSRPTFDLTGYSYHYLTVSLKTLVDTDAIRKYGKGQTKHYALNLAGRQLLTKYNPLRFSPYVMELNKKLSKHPDRARLRGDVAALLSCAGYGVHIDDKLPLPAFTPPQNQPDHQHIVSLCRNITRRTYPDAENNRVYAKRLTAIGSYYDSTTIKALFPRESSMDNEGINYARACGVLMTPDCLLRVYHSRDVALKFLKTGENNFRNRLLGDHVFRGFRPAGTDAVLIFGAGFTSASHIIMYSLDGINTRMSLHVKKSEAKQAGKRKVVAGERLTPSNLGKPSYYLPLDVNGMAMAALFQYPGWEPMLNREIYRQAFGVPDQPGYYHELDERKIYVLASLNMNHIERAIQQISTQPNPATIVCLNWQEPLFRELLTPIHGRSIQVLRMPDSFVDEAAGKLNDFWKL